MGDEVTVLARDHHKIPAFLELDKLSIVKGGLDDHETIRMALAGQDACIHNALYWEEEPTELQLKDTRTSVDLFESAANAGVKHLIYTSSTAVARPFKAFMTEDARLTPTDFYGATKAASEIFLSAFSYQTEMRCNVIRPGPTVGKPAVDGAPTTSDRRLKEFVRAALAGDALHVIRADGRQFIGAEDLAKLYSAVLRSDVNRETYFAVARNFTLWEDIARDAVSLVQSESSVVVREPLDVDTPQVFDTRKMEHSFGFVFDSSVAVGQHIAHLAAVLAP